MIEIVMQNSHRRNHRPVFAASIWKVYFGGVNDNTIMLVGGIVRAMDVPARDTWARNQAYIALGNLLTGAALLDVDVCPMEGFDRAQSDEILGLKDEGYGSAVIATPGYRDSSDRFSQATKVHPRTAGTAPNTAWVDFRFGLTGLFQN
jgi:hypothetical protein